MGNADFRRRSGHRSSSGCARVCINHVVTGQALCLAEYRNEIRARACRLTCRADKPRTSSSSGELTCYVWRADRLSRNPIRIRHKTDTDRGGGSVGLTGMSGTSGPSGKESRRAARIQYQLRQSATSIAHAGARYKCCFACSDAGAACVPLLLFVFGRCPLRCLNPPPADTSDIVCTYQ